MIKRLLLSVFFSLTLFIDVYAQVEVFSEQVSMGSALNSSFDESNIVVSPDESQIYFTRKNHPENVGGSKDMGDIWMSEHNVDGTWSEAVNLVDINTEGVDQFVGFLDLERNIVVYSGSKLKQYHRVGGKWFESGPVKVQYLKNNGKMFFASISSNARHMFFSMESFGTYGVEDLYVSIIQSDGTWGAPKNLGPLINTANQEVSAFLAVDNKTLFFASNGHGGEGSFDIFMSVRQDDTWKTWSKPVNMGSKINSNGSETSFVLSAEKDYSFLISTQNSDGYGDLKKVKIADNIEKPLIDYKEEEEPDIAVNEELDMVCLTGEVRNSVTKRVLVGAEVDITIYPSGEKKKARTNRMGRYKTNVAQGEAYDIKVSGFQYMSAEVSMKYEEAVEEKIKLFTLQPVVEGNTVALDNVLFIQGKSELLKGSEKELDLLVEMMKYNPKIKIFLSGHTDNQGKANLNLKLSEERVEVVEDYLIDKGINRNRISGQGFGGTKPRASNANPETRKLNRRVEFTIHTEKK